MVIEKFKPGLVKELYARFDSNGRMLPDGLRYIDSWINNGVSICYQLMETEDPGTMDAWISKWQDLSDFEVVPVISSAAAKQIVLEEHSSK